MKKHLSLVWMLCVIAVIFALTTFAATENGTVNVRIEGKTDTLFYGNVNCNLDNDATLYDVLLTVDISDNGIDLVDIENGYISAVNNETSARTARGWDGFGIRLNGKYISYNELGSTRIQNGDEVVIYYADEFGDGLYIPIVDIDKLDKGIIRFTAEVPVEGMENSYTVVPIEGATVLWYFEDAFVSLTTNASGEITLERGLLSAGDHKLQIIQNHENGIPKVLRLAPDYTVKVAAFVGDPPMLYILITLMGISAIGLGALFVIGRNKKTFGKY